MNELKKIHAHTLRNGIDFTKFLIAKLIEIPNIPYAQKLFDLIPKPSVFLYNKLIQAYSCHGPHHQCFPLYKKMCFEHCMPNQYSFTFLFAACSDLPYPHQGQMFHAHFFKWGFKHDLFIATALINMYSKLGLLELAEKQFNEIKNRDTPTWNSLIAGHTRNGDMEGALELFKAMPSRNVISWTTMVSGYSQNGQYENALAMFLEMEKDKGARPNEVTIASVLPACANLGALEVGERIENYARAKGYFYNMFVCNAVLEVYSRCGNIDKALQVFDEIGSRRNLCTWNTMIMGLAVHGKCNKALALFHQMLGEGTRPDNVTFVGAILACTHGGMVTEGWEIFKSMGPKFNTTPKLEHYGCMVDLLGRAGKLQEAYNLITTMPMEPDSVVWGTLLGACSFHSDVELAEKAAEALFVLEPWNPGNYVILSNIYATTGKWDGVSKLRKAMKGSQIRKAAGYSLIEVGGRIHKFIVGERSHPGSDEVYKLLDEVSTKMKKLHLHTDDFELF